MVVSESDPLFKPPDSRTARYLGAGDYFSALHKSSIDGERRVGDVSPSCAALRAGVSEAARSKYHITCVLRVWVCSSTPACKDLFESVHRIPCVFNKYARNSPSTPCLLSILAVEELW